MLELDLLLMAYLEQVYPGLTPAGQRVFAGFLEEPDGQIYHWLLGGGTPDPAFFDLVQDIRGLATSSRTAGIMPAL